MRYLTTLICLIIVSCHNEITIQLECEEFRRGSLRKTFFKLDTIEKIEEGRIIYNSTMDLGEKYNRKWILPHINSKDSILNYNNYEGECISKLLTTKRVITKDKEYEIIKYRIDDLAWIDEESNKFYCQEFGVILETFWKRNYIKTTKFNGQINENLNCIIEEIILDERFMWSHK